MAEISIIMPVYNAERYVDRAIKSVLSQTFYDFEFIIVNDGSQDHSLSIIKKYAADRRIKIINKQNEGVSAARNAGMEIATGEYISFLDSDDVMEIDLLEKTVSYAQETKADLLMFGYYKEQLSPLEKVVSSTPIKMKKGSYTRESPPDWTLTADSLAMIGYIWNKLYRRDILVQHHISFNLSLNYLEDIDFNTSVLKVINRLSILDECYYRFKRRNHVLASTKSHPPEFNHQLTAIHHQEEILNMWANNSKRTATAVAFLHTHAIKTFCADLFKTKNNIRFLEKCAYLNEAINRPLTRQRMKLFRPANTTDWFFKLAVQSRLSMILALISTLHTFPQELPQEKTS